MKETDLKLLTLAKELFDKDKQFPLCYKSYVLSMEYYQGKQEGLSAGQKGYLEKLLSFHRQVAKVGQAISGKRREEIKTTLEELLGFIKNRGDHALDSYRASIQTVVDQIEGGYYLWRSHLGKGIKLTQVVESHLGKNDKPGREKMEKLRKKLAIYQQEMPPIAGAGNKELADFFKWYYKKSYPAYCPQSRQTGRQTDKFK